MTAGTESGSGATTGRRPIVGLDVGKALGALDGIARYVRGLVAGLVEIEAGLSPERRFDYRLYPLFPCERELAFEDLVGGAEGFSLADDAGRLPSEIDLFHATAWTVPASFRGPLTLTLYDLTFLTLPDAHTVENRGRCLVGLSRALARGGAFCAISNSVRDEAAGRFALDPDAITVAPPAVAPAFAPRGSAEIERTVAELGIVPPYVLAVGTREPRKNLQGLLEAWSLLPADLRAGHRLVVAGARGWSGAAESESPEQVSSRLGLGDEVHWLGRVSDELLPALYSGAAAFVYPSLAEGFGLPPLEAMACGTPVVASDRPALPEVLGDAAVLVDPRSPAQIADGLTRVLKDRARAAELRERGLRRAGLYTWRATAEAVRALWQRELAGGGGRLDA